jgi:hypothetical protein
LAAALALPRPLQAASLPGLQIVTSVVNISIPVGAFNPATGSAQVTVSRGLVVKVDADRSWKLQMRSTSSVLLLVDPAGTGASKPVSDMTLRGSSSGQLFVPSTSFIQVANGGNTNGWSQIAFDVILKATAADSPGTYTTTLQIGFK